MNKLYCLQQPFHPKLSFAKPTIRANFLTADYSRYYIPLSAMNYYNYIIYHI